MRVIALIAVIARYSYYWSYYPRHTQSAPGLGTGPPKAGIGGDWGLESRPKAGTGRDWGLESPAGGRY